LVNAKTDGYQHKAAQRPFRKVLATTANRIEAVLAHVAFDLGTSFAARLTGHTWQGADIAASLENIDHKA